MSGNKINSEMGVEIGEALKQNTQLSYLNLHGNNLGNDGCGAIFSALTKNKTLTSLL